MEQQASITVVVVVVLVLVYFVDAGPMDSTLLMGSFSCQVLYRSVVVYIELKIIKHGQNYELNC